MSLNFLDFEQPIAELEAKIDSLTAVSRQDEKLDINIDEEVHRLREKSVELTRKIFADLGAWQVAQLARHPQRPYTLDYVRLAFDEFDELAGDRAYADDKAIVGGIARLDGRPVMIIGHQKGRETKEKIRRNFGMPAPEGYRKALRLMEMAERFNMPIITFIDTPGAYPGVGAEERGQSEAIARNLREMSRLKVPVICTGIGEGGSGGALAIGVGFGTQTIIKNFISGIIILFERKIRVGDIIELGGMTGHVTAVDLRATTVRGFNGVEALVPNSSFLENQVVNWTYSNQQLRRELKVGVAYGSDSEVTTQLLIKAACDHQKVLKTPAPEVYFEDFADSALLMVLIYWVELGPGTVARRVDSDLRHTIYRRLTEAGIAIPFPQRDVHLDWARPVPVIMMDGAS